MSRHRVGSEFTPQLKRNSTISIIPTASPSRKSSAINSIPNSPARTPDTRDRVRKEFSPRKTTAGYESPASSLEEEELSVVSAASVQSDYSYRSQSSGGSRRSLGAFKERVDRKLQKPDYTYRYSCHSEKDQSNWEARFEKPLEEFIYPSLQISSARYSSPDAGKDNSRHGIPKTYDTMDPGGTPTDEIEYPKWKHIAPAEQPVKEEQDDLEKFKDDLSRGEKFIRESLQRNYRKRLKQDADEEKKKKSSASALKKSKKLKSKFSMIENGVGMLLGDNNAFFLPKPADEVYKSLIANSRTKVNTASLFKRALNKITTQTAMERMHAQMAPQVYETVGEQDAHLADGLLLYQMKNKLHLDAKEDEKRRVVQKENEQKGLYRSGMPNKLALRRRNSQSFLESDMADPFAPAELSTEIPATPAGVIGGSNKGYGFEDAELVASNLSRVHRAVDSRNIGFEFSEVITNFGNHERIPTGKNDPDNFFDSGSFSFPPVTPIEKSRPDSMDTPASVSAEPSMESPDNGQGLQIATNGSSFFEKPQPSTFYDSKPGSPVLPGSYTSFILEQDGTLPRSNSVLPGHVLTTQTSRMFQREKGGKLSSLHLPVVAGVQDEETSFQKKVRAKDVLLMNQLRSGLIPEQLLKRVPNSMNLVVLHLSHYGLGDELGKCLGACLSSLSMLDAIGLCANRLTGKSISVILDNLNLEMLNHIDLSENDMRGKGTEALVKMVHKPNKLRILELSHCKLGLRDFSKMCSALTNSACVLEELCISKNNLTAGSAKHLAEVLLVKKSPLKWIDASWNSFDATSGAYLAEALKENKSLHYFDLSSNSLKDSGGQELAAALDFNKTLKVLLLNINGIGGNACFVFSKTLAQHPSMKQIDLSMNPLGEPGARALFRMILKGIKCFVHMKNCTYPDDPLAFNHGNPSLLSPYTLNLKDPYHNAVFHELLSMFRSGHNCTIDSLSHKPENGGKEVNYNLAVKDDEVVTRNNGYYWDPPTSGTVRVEISYKISIPSEADAINKKMFNVIINDIILQAKSDTDRKNYLWLICMDCFFTTRQAQKLIDTLRKKNLIEIGAITLVNVVQYVWENIVDTANKHDFLCNNLDEEEKLQLGYGITFEKLKFNYLNATGHWRLDMGNRIQRNVMQQLLALNTIEAQFSEKQSRRGDTSQKGNYGNFRNERLNSSETCIDIDMVTALGYHGVLEFDYVSTTRPSKTDVATISNSELELLFQKLGLSPRRRMPNSKAMFKLLELQIAVTKYYFTTANVLTFMDCFMQDDSTQAKVAIALFSRLKDLENFHVIMRVLRVSACKIVVDTLGLLNVINPLMPAHDYKLSLKYADNRIFLHSLVSLASNEGGDMVKEYARTEVLMITLFAAMGRIIQDSQDKTVIFGYCEIGERICNPNWNIRKDLVKLFLVGTHPIDHAQVFRTISMYKELEEAKTLGHGPIDLQYRAYLKKKENPEKPNRKHRA